MKLGYIRYGINGDCYLIPTKLIKEFNVLVCDLDKSEPFTDEWYVINDEIEARFSQYAIDDISHLKVVIPNT